VALQSQTRRFDPLFARHANGLPVAYLRALANAESGLDPTKVNSRSGATGLFQITQPALSSFNDRHRLRLELPHLSDPALNTRVATDHLASILGAYRARQSLSPDWESRRWVELLTLGWNAGHNALTRIVERLEQMGLPVERITAEAVGEAAAALRRRYLSDPARVAWARRVADAYFGPREEDRMVALQGASAIAPALGLVALGTVAAGRRPRRAAR
jgi:hypothetical protein